MFEIGHISHPGKKRLLNEDSYDIDMSRGIALVVDGLGGTNAGDIASAFVRETLHKALSQGESPSEALINSGQALRIQRPPQGSSSPSGASAVAVRFDRDTIRSAWLGTCRSLLCNGRQTGTLMPTESSETKTSSTIQALGITASDKLNLIAAEAAWQRGHSLLLCTDELLAACSLERINTLLINQSLSAQECVDQLLFEALQGEANNNLSLVVIRRT